jgi:hypothetical protein
MPREEWRKPKELYPTRIQQLTRCPMRGTIERIITGQSRTFESNAKLAIGKDVHKAVEKSFGFLQKNKTDWLDTNIRTGAAYPGADLIERTIREAQTIAEGMLSSKQSTASTLPAVKETIQEWGKEYLENKSTDLYVEKNLVSKNFPWTNQIGGQLDMLLIDKERKVMKVIDHKTTAEISTLMDSLDPKKGIQPLFYTHLAWNNAEMLNVKNPQSVEFIYNLIPNDNSGKSSRMLLSHLFNQSDVSKIPNEISVQLAKVSTIEMIAYNKIKAGRGSEGVSDAIHALKKEAASLGGCNPNACSSCPLRFNCTFSKFVQDVIGEDRGTDKFISSRIDKYNESLGDLFKDSRYEKEREYKAFTKTKLKEYERQVTKDITDKRRDLLGVDVLPEEETKFVRNRVQELTNEMDNSWKAHHKYNTNKFMHNLETGAKSATSSIPFSILGVGEEYHNRSPWMSFNLRNSINYYAKERIGELSAVFNVKPEVITDKAMKATFTDRKMALELETSLFKNIRTALSDAGANATEENVALALKRYDLIIDKPLVQNIFNNLDQNTVKIISDIEYDKVNNKLSSESAKKALSSGNMGNVINDLQSTEGISDRSEYFWKRIARRETMTSLTDRYKISPGKFPFRPAAAAAMLTYIAGVFSVRNILSRKVEKLGDMVTADKEVSDGTHLSPISIVRRTLSSDFGSRRTYVPGGVGETAATVGIFSKAFTTVKKYTSNLLSRFGVSEDAIRSKIKISSASSLKALFTGSMSPGILFAGTAIASLAAMAILPNIKTDREIAKDVKDKAKERKRIRKEYYSKDSSMVNDKSDIREAYQIQAPFFHAISFNKLMEKGSWLYNSAAELARDMGLGRISAAQAIGTHRDMRWIQTNITDKVSRVVSNDLVERPYSRMKRWAKGTYEKTINAVHRDIDQLQVVAGKHKNTIEKAKSTVSLVKEKMDKSSKAQPSQRREANTLRDKFENIKEKWKAKEYTNKLKKTGDYALLAPAGVSSKEMPIVIQPRGTDRRVAANSATIGESFQRREISSNIEEIDSFNRNIMRKDRQVVPMDVSIQLPNSNIVKHAAMLDGGVRNYDNNKHSKYYASHNPQPSQANYSKYAASHKDVINLNDSKINSSHNKSITSQIVMSTGKASKVREYANISDHFIPLSSSTPALKQRKIITNQGNNRRAENTNTHAKLISLNKDIAELRSPGHTRYGMQREINHNYCV